MQKDFGAYVDDKNSHIDASFLPSEMISLTSLQESGVKPKHYSNNRTSDR